MECCCAEISWRTLGERKAIRRVLDEATLALHCRSRRQRSSKLEPFREYLLQRSEQKCTNVVVLLQEIAKQGHTGKISILRKFLALVRQELVRQRETTEQV